MDSPSCQFLDHDDMLRSDTYDVLDLGCSGMVEGCEDGYIKYSHWNIAGCRFMGSVLAG